ncbi:MAG TPA: RDD family protein [Bryobacteraceae bacterium]|nr:RDD family protein [Bryobacteraceae bacterium]
MECRYCQTSNSEDDHRCRRCGRRLRMTPPYMRTAAAPALQHEMSERAAPGRPTIASPAPEARPATYQPSLFTSREFPRVVPFESIAPPGSVEPATRKSASSPSRQRPRKVIAGQQNLEFSPRARSARVPEGAIYCDAPVAVTAHRMIAAALDGSVVLISLALFGLVFYLAGGQIVLNAKTAPLFIAVVAALIALYRLLWCFAETDSPGMRWAHLALINFDGQTPGRRQRMSRAAAGFLSLAAGGLGLLWALVDEETLTWHDHISKTFPTPR